MGILNEQGPLSLDEITNRLQHNFKKYWGFSRGVVSSAATKLEKERYIVLSNQCERDQYVYRVTPEGRMHLHKLIRDAFKTDEIFDFTKRHHVLIRLGFLHHLPECEQVAVLNTIEDQLAEERRRWFTIQRTHEQEHPDTAVQTGYRRDLIQLNVTMLNTLLEWVEEIDIRTLDADATSP